MYGMWTILAWLFLMFPNDGRLKAPHHPLNYSYLEFACQSPSRPIPTHICAEHLVERTKLAAEAENQGTNGTNASPHYHVLGPEKKERP